MAARPSPRNSQRFYLRRRRRDEQRRVLDVSPYKPAAEEVPLEPLPRVRTRRDGDCIQLAILS